jgi:hypothetical protein
VGSTLIEEIRSKTGRSTIGNALFRLTGQRFRQLPIKG